MTFKKLTVAALCTIILASSPLYAKSFSGDDVCATVGGTWAGVGTVSALGGKVKCKYHGTAEVSPTADPHAYNADVDLHKDSGACPPDEIFALVGTCNNGVIQFTSDIANLSGTVSEDGKTADMTGTVVIDVYGAPVTANVDSMHLTKQ